MRATGNMKQWTDGNPSEEQILNDIADGHSYIVEDDGIPVATFAFIAGPDVTYANIYEGEWLDEVRPYYVIHRIASVHTARGMLADGAVDAARFMVGKGTGLYNMENILG